MILNRIPHIYHDTIYAKKIFEIIEEKHRRIREMFAELSMFNDYQKSKGALLDVAGGNFKVNRLNRPDDIENLLHLKFQHYNLSVVLKK